MTDGVVAKPEGGGDMSVGLALPDDNIGVLAGVFPIDAGGGDEKFVGRDVCCGIIKVTLLLFGGVGCV